VKENKTFNTTTYAPGDTNEEMKSIKLNMKHGILCKLSILAVCSALILGVSLLIFGGEDTKLCFGAIVDVTYPKAYAFDDGDSRREIREHNPVDKGFIEAINDFSYKTGSLILSNTGKNINYSPISLYYDLSLVTSGAKGETEAQLLNLLGVSDSDTLSMQCGNLYRLLYRDNKMGKLKIANSIWMDNDMNGEPIEFKEDFVKHVVDNFYTSSHSVDFSKKETAKAMSEWIAKNTNGTLSPSIEFVPDQIISILNTVYFYDQWIDRFDISKTEEDVFRLSNGTQVRNDFMNQTFGSAGFAKGEGFTRAGLGLKNSNQMVFILPDEGVSPYELLSSPEQIREIFEGGTGFNGEVVWKIPKFSFTSKPAITDVLKKLGVNSAFTPNADFTGITNHIAYITDVHQETHIAIDENGVEASSFTHVYYAGAALPQGRADMILNRPFIYGIKAQTGNLLFVGVCENPAER